MSNLIPPGKDNQSAGTYKEVGPRGGAVPDARVVQIRNQDRLPPTQQAGNKWKKQR